MKNKVSLQSALTNGKKALKRQHRNMLLKSLRIAKGCGIPIGLERYEIFYEGDKKYIRFSDTYSVSHRTMSHTMFTADTKLPLADLIEARDESGITWVEVLKELAPSYIEMSSLRELEKQLDKDLESGAKYLPLGQISNNEAVGVYLYTS